MLSKKNLITELQERGLISQITYKKELKEKLSKESIKLYCGFDPTSDSLHLGHLVPLLCLKRFQKMGHQPIVLIGGATGLIGDPSFKNRERILNSNEKIQEWTEKIQQQVLPFLEFNCGKNSAKIINNYEWFHKMDVLSFLRDIGKHFSINKMINKEAIKQRIDRVNSGISFTEFSYNLLQSYDFANLHQQYNVELQIGGSDQWGNIITGITLIRRLYNKQVFGLTVPLITNSDGSKLGKTESEVIWLNPKKTSPYKLYQFWVNVSDVDVYRFLKFFTFMSIEEINTLQKEDKNGDKAPKAKYVLAEKVTQLVHGKQSLQAAKRITESLFSDRIIALTAEDFSQLEQDGMEMIQLNSGSDLQQALVEAKLAASRGQAKNMINSNAITINGKKCNNPKYIFRDEDRLFGKYSLIKRGKKHHCLITWY